MHLDATALRPKRLEEFTAMDLEALRLILRGDSVIDWQRLHLSSLDEALAFLRAQEFQPGEPGDQTRLEAIRDEAVGYLRRHFHFPIPRPIASAHTEDLLLIASGRGHRQLCACTILKVMQIIHHLDGRELLFSLPLSDQEVFHLVEEKTYRVIGEMMAAGFPITEFVGGRKNKDSLYTKLLSKAATSASAIYDKLRFRIVTRDRDDILPVLLYLSQHLVPFNYVMAGQSVNTVLPFRSYCDSKPALRDLLEASRSRPEDQFTPTDNTFSDESYRIIHFIADVPVRLPQEMMDMVPPAAWPLGSIVFVMCEFQLVDRESEAGNEVGEASHDKYKERQKHAVMRRLKLGDRALRAQERPSKRTRGT